MMVTVWLQNEVKIIPLVEFGSNLFSDGRHRVNIVMNTFPLLDQVQECCFPIGHFDTYFLERVRDKKVTGTRRTTALNQAAAFNSEEARRCPQKPSKSWFMTAQRMSTQAAVWVLVEHIKNPTLGFEQIASHLQQQRKLSCSADDIERFFQEHGLKKTPVAPS